jgi:transposase
VEIVNRRCAGLDVHKKTVVVCRTAPRGNQPGQETKTFGTTTPELLALSDWLEEWQITHVAMESTGDYWRPVYNVLEGHFTVWVVNAQHVKQVPGRKTDVKDAEWLADLLRHGLLKPSYVPERTQRALRDLTRYRTKLVQQRAQVVNRLQKVLEDANIKLASVASNVLGASGRAILAALIAGETDGVVLSQLARGRLREKQDALAQALTGYMDEHHRFLLSSQLELFDFLSQQIESLSQRIEQQMAAMDGENPPSPDTAQERPECDNGHPSTEAQEPLTHQQAVALLDTIPGVNRLTADVMVAEIGLEQARFPSHRQLAAWAGVAPGNDESAGKRYSGRTRRGNRWLRSALCQAAWAAAHTKESHLSALYHRLAARRGKKRAILAVAHSILVSAYHMLQQRQPYQELGDGLPDPRRKAATIRHLSRRLRKLGVEVPELTTAVAS